MSSKPMKNWSTKSVMKTLSTMRFNAKRGISCVFLRDTEPLNATSTGVTTAVKSRAAKVTPSQRWMKRLWGSMIQPSLSRSRFRTASTSSTSVFCAASSCIAYLEGSKRLLPALPSMT